jgi:hypothetical protein
MSTVLREQAVKLPTGTTAQRPASPTIGFMRFNTDSNLLEYYNGSNWIDVNIFQPTSLSGLIGWYDTFSVSGTTWTDKSGSGNNATISGATVVSTSGNGAALLNQALHGSSTAHTVQFPAAIVPSTYTLFHVNRYTGGTNSRILTSTTASGAGFNWLSGHHSGNAGVAYHGGWLTPITNIHGNNWVLSVDQNQLYRSNGVTRGTSGGATSPSVSGGDFSHCPSIGINSGSEQSTWMSAEIIVYNRTLPESEWRLVENYLATKYGIALT